MEPLANSETREYQTHLCPLSEHSHCTLRSRFVAVDFLRIKGSMPRFLHWKRLTKMIAQGVPGITHAK